MLALVSLFAGLALAAAPMAGTQTWSIDPAQSQAQFSVRKFWFVHVRGTFPGLRGSLRRVDTRVGADLGQVDAALDVAGLEMDDARDSAHALGPDLFDAAQFPVIRFDSDPFPLDELVTGGTLRGRLTLHGQRHPVDLILQPSDCPGEPIGCAIRARGTILRAAFGMRAWRGMLSDRVDLELTIVLRSSVNAASPARRPNPGTPGS